MAAKQPDPSRHLKVRDLIEQRNQLQQQIRSLFEEVRKIDQQIMEARLALRRRS